MREEGPTQIVGVHEGVAADDVPTDAADDVPTDMRTPYTFSKTHHRLNFVKKSHTKETYILQRDVQFQGAY